MLLVLLLLFIPIIASENTADLGYICDEKKCVFSLAIPQSAVTFVNVELLQSEIDGLNQNVTQLKDYEEIIEKNEDSFNSDFADLYSDAQSMLSGMFDLASTLNATASSSIVKATKQKNEASTLNDALACMVAGILSPEECGNLIPDIPTTTAPATTVPLTSTVVPSTVEETTTGSVVDIFTTEDHSTPGSGPTDASRTTHTDVTDTAGEPGTTDASGTNGVTTESSQSNAAETGSTPSMTTELPVNCAANPNGPGCPDCLADPSASGCANCETDPTAPGCLPDCGAHPNASGCPDCVADPTAPGCPDCTTDPEAPGCPPDCLANPNAQGCPDCAADPSAAGCPDCKKDPDAPGCPIDCLANPGYPGCPDCIADPSAAGCS